RRTKIGSAVGMYIVPSGALQVMPSECRGRDVRGRRTMTGLLRFPDLKQRGSRAATVAGRDPHRKSIAPVPLVQGAWHILRGLRRRTGFGLNGGTAPAVGIKKRSKPRWIPGGEAALDRRWALTIAALVRRERENRA